MEILSSVTQAGTQPSSAKHKVQEQQRGRYATGDSEHHQGEAARVPNLLRFRKPLPDNFNVPAFAVE